LSRQLYKRLGIGLLLALAVWVFIYKAAPRMPDFEVYWRAAARAAQAEPLYRTTDGHYQFKYLPAFAVLAVPLGVLSLSAAKLLWFAISVALLVYLIVLNVRLPPQLLEPTHWIVVGLVITFGKFYAHELVLGQVNVLFALAIVIKPYAVLFLPWLAARGKFHSTAAACGGLALALALPIPLYGFSGNIALHREWWRTVTETTAPNLSVYDNVSLAAMYFRWVGPGPLSARLAVATAIVLLVVAAIVFLMRRGITFPEGLEGGLLLTLMPLLSPQGWDYVFLIATPAVVYLVNYRSRLAPAWRGVILATLAAIGLSLFDLMGRTAYYAFMRLSIISVLFFVVIGTLVLLRLKKIG
jgi:hypothetical protein